MQFHLNGFEPGDPEIADTAQRYPESGAKGALPAEVDVLVVGCGPAGLTLATQLAAFPDIKTVIAEQKTGPLLRGQADGIACRTVEMFEAFGFSEKVLKEACWINETTFWKPDDRQPANIASSGRIQDVEDGLSEFPHVVLNQARVHDFYLDVMRKSPAKLEPHYARRLIDLHIDTAGNDPHRVTARFERVDEAHQGEIETIKARYVVGCDGARSQVRKSIGRTLEGDSANHAWGVMDVLAVTDFPDVRMKSLIQSAADGSIIIIPREGGYLFRIYVEMDKLDEGERVGNRNIAADQVIAAARRVFKPYTLDVKEVAWWSVYEIGQRLCDKFDNVEDGAADELPCVFIAGDACHTHSPKAGQGMNVSMQDGFNLGWKLASVLRGRAKPQLLHTYSGERQAVAKELIDFDREWAKVISSSKGADPAETQRYFVQHGRYTAGTATRYRPALLTGEPTHQHLAKGLTIGTRFHSAPVIRVGDAMKIELGHTVKADGRWRLFAFAPKGDAGQAGGRLRALCDFLATAAESPIRKYTPAGADIDAVFDVRAIVQQGHRDVAINAMPPLLLPAKGKFGLRDYEKVFAPDLKGGHDIFDMRGVDRAQGCLVIVRPDQYVAHVLPMHAYEELATYFDGFMLTA
ncbi:phenol 2-monooxygenase [Pseudolabrys sp. Root1462]|uniref:FAD-binding monooxygenase n=1 Tax=Pseudolabrys sp. Root1462 TaxID=1736466 RepID=UPI00070391CC|nr:FAD-binding monooxygenase [Pseudolabrys sp. Root1462]KQZ00532.1 phenol 2-monooxygenase [Pseudolabrys sp. Root1462]